MRVGVISDLDRQLEALRLQSLELCQSYKELVEAHQQVLFVFTPFFFCVLSILLFC
jgi:hypothetical protein